MAALVCDLCGGKLIMGAGGIAVCDSCGMEHSANRMKEKVQEIKGTVQVDNSHMIENYLEIAQNAKDVENHEEAESYCNKVLEIDPKNYKAWMLKGKAVAWQSTLQNSRIDEGVAAFVKAINNAPDGVKENLIEEAKEQIQKLAIALIQLRSDRFVKWPDNEESIGFFNDITSIYNAMTAFISQTGEVIYRSSIMAPIATCINQSVVKAWKNVIWPEYNGDPNDSEDRPRKHEWKKFIDRVEHCTNLVEQAIRLCNEDDEADIQRYENLIFMHQAAIDSCAWDYKFTDWGKSWYKTWELTDNAKNIRQKLIRGYEEKVSAWKSAKAKKEEEEAKKRLEAYWAEHLDEKIALETARVALNDEIESLQNKLANILEHTEKKNIQERIDALNTEKASLGLFQGKAKKAIQEKIDAANLELKIVVERIATIALETNNKIHPLRKRIYEIDVELTKER